MHNEHKQYEEVSKYLSYILRHEPHSIGLKLDGEGWVCIEALIAASRNDVRTLDDSLVRAVVAHSPKKRFQISSDLKRIRAVQGHTSSEVRRTFLELAPPPLLYHGTATRFVASIQNSGLQKGKRQHVHLSTDRSLALSVGARYGAPVVLVVPAQIMAAQGHRFFLAENDVWLTDSVPPSFLRLSRD